MKYITLILALLVLGSCEGEPEVEKEEPLKPLYKFTIGQEHVLCPRDDGDPFKGENPAIIRITNVRQGYIQYCYSIDYNKSDRLCYSRSREAFIRLIENCK